MEDLKDLVARTARPGALVWIGLRPARREAMVSIGAAEIAESGLVGDHGRPGKRAVTLMQAEHLVAIGSYLGKEAVLPEDLRRNLVVSGLNLLGLRGRRVQIGTAAIEIAGPCAPCSRMEETFGHGGYAAVRGHGGMTAQVVTSGQIALGDAVVPSIDHD